MTLEQEAVSRLGPRHTLAEEVTPLSIPLFLLAFGLSCLASYLLLKDNADMVSFPWFGFLIHTVSSLLTGVGIAVALGPEETARYGWAAFLGVFAFLAGPVGVVGGIVSYLMARGQPTRTPLTEVVKAEMFVTVVQEEEPEDFATMDLKIREQSQVEPIIDMLPMADITTAIAIVNRLRERGQRPDIEMIRRVSSDPRPEVYQYALAILAKMEKSFAAQVYALQEEIAQQSESRSDSDNQRSSWVTKSPKLAALRIEMAKLHLDYIQSGLLDESLCDYYWELSLSYLFEAMLVNPMCAELGADLAQLLALKGLNAQAGTVASVVLKKNPAMLQAQLLVVASIYEKALEEGSSQGLLSAKRAALESAWAVTLPKKRTADIGLTYDLAHFWFGGRDA